MCTSPEQNESFRPKTENGAILPSCLSHLSTVHSSVPGAQQLPHPDGARDFAPGGGLVVRLPADDRGNQSTVALVSLHEPRAWSHGQDGPLDGHFMRRDG